MSMLIGFLIFFLGSCDTHEFHLSKCLINENIDSNSLEITIHIFIDDLEATLADSGAKDLKICTEDEHEKAEDYFIEYLSQTLQVVVNDKPLDLEFIGKEISEDLAGMWCYLEAKDVGVIKNIEITNSILLEKFNDQQNVVNVKLQKAKESFFIFQKTDYTETIEIDN